jgi:hypothetical protein
MGTRAFFPCRRVPAKTRRATSVPLGLLPFALVVLLVLVAGLLSGCGCGTADLSTTSTSAGGPASSSSSSSSSTSSSMSSSTTSSTEAAFVQLEGEIFLEPAGTSGPESFAGEIFVPVIPPATLVIPTSTTSTTQALSSTTTAAGGEVQVASYPGDTPALYGGSKSRSLVGKGGQLRFFEENPDKAAAFCAALNADTTFRWTGGAKIRPDQLSDYFAGLTPMMLTRDTRVTNHGYRDGRPTPRQSVLQAGQTVLVDRYGVPRVRCECGNPLTPPKPVRTTPRYTGQRWPRFDPAAIIAVQRTTVMIDTFVLIDVYTGQTFDRPAGTDGSKDAAHTAGTWRLDVEMKRFEGGLSKRTSTIKWSAELTAAPDAKLSGTGTGTWHCDGTTWEGAKEIGTFTADVSITINIVGTIDTTGLGRTLRIKPVLGDYTVDSLAITPEDPEIRADFNKKVAGLIQDAFTELDLKADGPAPLFASVAAGGYLGSATLTPLK